MAELHGHRSRPVVAGFSVLWSNNLDIAAGGTDYHVLAGTREAISFAGQVNKTEAYRVEDVCRCD